MCYAKPGPRCDSVARKRLYAAKKAYQDDPSDQKKELLNARKLDYYLTSEGIDKLRAHGREDLADRCQTQRDRLIQESKRLAARAEFGKWSGVPLKDMDAGGLTQAALELSYDETISWGTSSREDFQRAINSATFWHMEQTRGNRAGYPRTPYIEHPLRNAIRTYRWGCTDGEVLTAIVLHDTLEDCSEKIIKDTSLSKVEARQKAAEKLRKIFGDRSIHIVEKVSNPIHEGPRTKEQKRIDYNNHVAATIYDPQVFLVKFADYNDNAGGLHHNYIKGQEGMVLSMYQKYSMALPVFKDAYSKMRDTLPVESNYQVMLALKKVESNLNNLGKRLSEDGLLK